MALSIVSLINVAIFLGACVVIFRLRGERMTLGRRVLAGLVAGIVIGLYLQIFFTGNEAVMSQTLAWINVVGGGYVALLRMIIMPLILVTMMASVLRLDAVSALGKIGGTVIGMLMFTTMIAALIGVLMASVFGLSAEGMIAGTRELARMTVLESRLESVADLTLPQMIVSFIPTNIFYDLTDARSNSIIAVVIFGMLAGLAALLVAREDGVKGERIKAFIEAAQAVIMKLVHMVMSLTPYGILALIPNVVAGSNVDDILSLISFVLASYIAIALMFVVHGVILFMIGTRVPEYFKLVWPVLPFAFVTRSSAATIPLNVETQIEKLKVPPSIANISASFGATIGQNGCAGIYPAMLAVMVAPTVGIDPLSIGFIVSLVGIIAISSFGIAGVGGGATYAALVVLPAMGLPVALVALLISIEPLIDMARTALNVNGAITSGMVTRKLLRIPA